jgi:hypothetical protein
MIKLKFFLLLAILLMVRTGWAAETKTTSDQTDPSLTNDASPNTVPGAYPAGDNAPFPQVAPQESELVKPYTLPPHRFLEGSIHHPNPEVMDQSFAVDVQKKTVQLAGGHQLYAFKDWAQERYFDAKFETLNKRFTEIERRLSALEAKIK